MSERNEVLGNQFGVRIIKRDNCPNDAVQIITEDDGNWFEVGQPFDAGWITDLTMVLQRARMIAKVEFKP